MFNKTIVLSIFLCSITSYALVAQEGHGSDHVHHELDHSAEWDGVPHDHPPRVIPLPPAPPALPACCVLVHVPAPKPVVTLQVAAPSVAAPVLETTAPPVVKQNPAPEPAPEPVPEPVPEPAPEPAPEPEVRVVLVPAPAPVVVHEHVGLPLMVGSSN